MRISILFLFHWHLFLLMNMQKYCFFYFNKYRFYKKNTTDG
jgi:hypothetical protein